MFDFFLDSTAFFFFITNSIFGMSGIMVYTRYTGYHYTIDKCIQSRNIALVILTQDYDRALELSHTVFITTMVRYYLLPVYGIIVRDALVCTINSTEYEVYHEGV